MNNVYILHWILEKGQRSKKLRDAVDKFGVTRVAELVEKIMREKGAID